MKPSNPELYQKIKDRIYKEQPKHSLYRSARIVKEYKEEGGTFEGKKTNNINKWFDEKWISLNDYLRNEIIPCGNSNTEKKYDEYPLCRPLNIAKKMKKEEIEKLIKEKDKLREKTLQTEKILGTKKYNINTKNIKGGMILKNSTFYNQLKELDFKPEDYLNQARKTALKHGYDPNLLNISDKKDKKLMYDNIYFGAPNYNDFLIYKHLEKNNLIPKGTAREKRKNYRKRALKVMKETKNKYSPASLSYYILW